MDSNNIYAIVVTYNGSKWIDKCFGSLVNSSVPSKILAIDNGSVDSTPDLIRQKFPIIEVIETGQNLGFGQANNIGLKRVIDENADYAFLLNQDAWIEKDTIQKLIEIHHRNSKFGILSPVPMDGGERSFDYLYSKYYINGIHKDIEYDDQTFEIDFINAAGWLISLETIKTIGGFHPKFNLHGEDVNYIDRIRYVKTLKIGITFSTKYYHDRQEREKDENTSLKRYYALKSKIKASIYNPNLSICKTFSSTIQNQIIELFVNKSQRLIHLKVIFYSFKIFLQALKNRQVYFKL